MQLLLSESEEFGKHAGLDIIPGQVLRFPSGKVPQVGWNQIFPNSKAATFLSGLEGEYMYFVHSYYVKPENPEVIASISHYEGVTYCSSLRWKNICATQYHPEKSAYKGLQIYKNWAGMIGSSSKGQGAKAIEKPVPLSSVPLAP